MALNATLRANPNALPLCCSNQMGDKKAMNTFTKRDTKSNLISMVFVDMFTKAYQWLNKRIIDIARNHCNSLF